MLATPLQYHFCRWHINRLTPALLTVTANDSNKTYGTANPAFTANFAGLTAGDVEGDYIVNFATAANANSNVGNYAVTPGGMADANYNITFVDGTLTIDPTNFNYSNKLIIQIKYTVRLTLHLRLILLV